MPCSWMRKSRGDVPRYLPAAWEILPRALVGNTEMRARGARTASGKEWTKHLRVNEGVRALDRICSLRGSRGSADGEGVATVVGDLAEQMEGSASDSDE